MIVELDFAFDVLFGLDFVQMMDRYHKLPCTVVCLWVHGDGLVKMVLNVVHDFLQKYMKFWFD